LLYVKEVLDFLNKTGVYYLATTEGDQPHVRPIGFVMECGGKLAFCTGNKKAMCKQLAENPKVEICAYDGANNILRICGEAVFATTKETQQQALDVMPALANLYSVGDGVFEIFYLDKAKAVCASMSGETRELPL
jgi:uncharacterized pyridoxamine 5'-phosphate oxidase family protein